MSESKPNSSFEENRSLWRVLDAAADRGREAVRVIEDAVRFLTDDAPLDARLKAFRHEYAALTALLSWDERLAARDAAADVGSTLEGAGEYRRSSLGTILAANFCRLQEALRSLEEFSKLAKPEMARRAERLRYASYTLQKDVHAAFTAADRLTRLSAARLYVLVTCGVSDDDAEKIALAGTEIFQLRDKSATDRELCTAGLRLTALFDRLAASGKLPARPLLIVNDRADLAAAVGADGVHLGQTELPPDRARRIIGPGLILGLSTSRLEEAREALAEIDGPARVDYLGAGSVFPTTTKPDARGAGLGYLRSLASLAIPVPVFAIGGINAENLPRVLETGIGRVCVASAVTGRADMGKAAEELHTILAQKEG
ncbi:MAG: thiamine phosphate synthase [Thermoguttaceae bacterium]|nr:thiamine phosphate synthase [Thermoguttaceae bacterium]